MKSTNFKLLVIAAIIAIGFVACKKPTDNTTNPYLYNSSKVVFDTNAIGYQTKTWTINDSSGDSTLNFAGGTQILFKDSSFIYNRLTDTNTATGTATFYVKEYFKPSDWIFSNMQTVDTGRRFIQSFGALSIAVVDGYGDTLDLDTIKYTPVHNDSLNKHQFRVRVPSSGNGYYNTNAYNPANQTMKVYVHDLDSLNSPSPTYIGYDWWHIPFNQDSFIYKTNSPPFYYTFRVKDSLSINRWYNLADSNAATGQPSCGLYKGFGTTTLWLQSQTSDSYNDVVIFFVLDYPWKVTVVKAIKATTGTNLYYIPNVPLFVTGKIVAWCVSSGKQLLSNYNVNNDNLFPDIRITSTTGSTTTSVTYKQIDIGSLTTAIKGL